MIDHEDDSTGTPRLTEIKLTPEQWRCFDSLPEECCRMLLKAGGLIPSEDHTASVAQTYSRFGENRRIAQHPRTDALQALIIQYIKDHPHATYLDVMKEFKKYERQGIFDSVTDDAIEWVNKDGRLKETTINSLKARFSRAKKKLQLR